MEFSASHSTSRKSNLPHNRRDEKYIGKNVMKDGIHEEWFRVEIEDLYHEIFSESIEKYNAKQSRNDRKMVGGSDGYLNKIRQEWDDYYSKGVRHKGQFVRAFTDYDDALSQLNFNEGRNPRSPYYESIVQIGNRDNQPDESTCRAILRDYFESFQERNPNLRLMECHYHADEATPHIHLDFVPVATGYKRGMEVQNGFDKALMQQMGLDKSGSKFKTPSIEWYKQESEILAEIALQHGVQISHEAVLEPGKKDHESVKAYKARMQGLEELDDKAYELELKEMEVRDDEVILINREYSLSKREKEADRRETELNDREANLNEREMNLNGRQSLLEAHERRLKEERDKWTEEQEKRSEALSEALRALDDVRREIDGVVIGQSERMVLDFLKSNPNPKKPNESMFESWVAIAKNSVSKRVSKIVDTVSELDAGKARTQDLARGRRVMPRNDGRQFGE